MKKLLTLCTALLLGTALSAQPPQETPGAEHKKLEHFVGTWKMDAKLNPGLFGPGGAMTGTETCRMHEGGFHLVCDSTGSGAMGNIKSHMIMAWDRQAKVYRYTSISNMADAEFATGTFKGNTWTFKSEIDMGGKKFSMQFTIVETTPTSHDMKMDVSEDGGKTWKTMMTGKSTKTK